MDKICAICHEGFHGAHAPIIIVGVPSCKGHVFGYQCLRNCIADKMPNSNKCPLCRTPWFEMGEGALRGLGEAWERVEGLEGWLLGRKTRAGQAKLLEEAIIRMGASEKRSVCAQVYTYTLTTLVCALIFGGVVFGSMWFLVGVEETGVILLRRSRVLTMGPWLEIQRWEFSRYVEDFFLAVIVQHS